VVEEPASCRMWICCLASSGVHVSLSRRGRMKPTGCYQWSVSKERGGSARVVVWLLVDALRQRTNNSAYMHTRHCSSYVLAVRHCPRATHQPPAALLTGWTSLRHASQTAYHVRHG
jgi:hypothetical protein